MPGLEELGWLQFERLCELVLEADAGVDPTRWEGSADQSREVVCEDALRLHGRTLAPPVLIRCQWSHAGVRLEHQLAQTFELQPPKLFETRHA